MWPLRTLAVILRHCAFFWSQTTDWGARRLVVKIGSDLVVDWNDGSINWAWLETLGDDVA
jgi:hypothetical protein